MKIHSEETKSDFNGTIIDLETIGDFHEEFKDSRRCAWIRPVIFGFIQRDKLEIYYAESSSSIKQLNEEIDSIIDELEKPFYAFNSSFESYVLFHNLGRKIEFERELNKEQYEKKEKAVSFLEISQYGDPFNGEGRKCILAWNSGDMGNAIAHNRSCLLKERDILLKRGYRNPEIMKFVNNVSLKTEL